MMGYRLRYFFDPGSGVCLWAANDSTRDHFGYAVNCRDLPLSNTLSARLQHLIKWFDTSLDWDDPGGPSRWSPDEHDQFRRAARDGLEQLRAELPPVHYEIIDETDKGRA